MAKKLILPPSFQAPKPSGIERVGEDLGVLVADIVNTLITEALKDLNGGIKPAQKIIRQHFQRTVHPDGQIFHWKSRPVLWVSPPRLYQVGDETRLDIKHKFLYREEPALAPVQTEEPPL